MVTVARRAAPLGPVAVGCLDEAMAGPSGSAAGMASTSRGCIWRHAAAHTVDASCSHPRLDLSRER